MQSINWKNAIIAGIVGTVLFDVFGLLMSGEWWDIPVLFGSEDNKAFQTG
ncbi:hypothetical protein [Cyclobacterium sp. SYSU L10401]|nr:hypothetical protein [Cyclobacterium sp. SYSU L10401]